MSCDACGAPCHGSQCRNCERDARIEKMDVSPAWYTCPGCGGTAASRETRCHKCRGGSE